MIKNKMYLDWVGCDDNCYICRCGKQVGSEQSLKQHIEDTHLKYLEIEFPLEKADG